ncbi:hypothetical protein [Streptomyces nojiriensis]|uniref:hypothetical protein n=1 Tax=Streptomyces nojiriensis TaxID=66374 RepID=UPI003647C69C
MHGRINAKLGRNHHDTIVFGVGVGVGVQTADMARVTMGGDNDQLTFADNISVDGNGSPGPVETASKSVDPHWPVRSGRRQRQEHVHENLGTVNPDG